MPARAKAAAASSRCVSRGVFGCSNPAMGSHTCAPTSFRPAQPDGRPRNQPQRGGRSWPTALPVQKPPARRGARHLRDPPRFGPANAAAGPEASFVWPFCGHRLHLGCVAHMHVNSRYSGWFVVAVSQPEAALSYHTRSAPCHFGVSGFSCAVLCRCVLLPALVASLRADFS